MNDRKKFLRSFANFQPEILSTNKRKFEADQLGANLIKLFAA